MSYSDYMFLDDSSIGLQKTIAKLTDRECITESSSVQKIKSKFVHSVVDGRDFKPAVTAFSDYVQSSGTAADQRRFSDIKNKIDADEMQYEDVEALCGIARSNFGSILKNEPTTTAFDSATILGFSLTAFAILLRCITEGGVGLDETANTIIAFTLVGINCIAIIYTLSLLPKLVLSKLTAWIAGNGVPDILQKRLINPVKPCIRATVILLGVLCIVIMAAISYFVNLSLGNDVLSIISLSLSVLSDKLAEILYHTLSRKIFLNEERYLKYE